MIEIRDLLARFEKILLPNEVRLEATRKIIMEVIGVQIKKEEIKIKNGSVYLNIKPIYKNEIFLKKEKIQEELGKFFGEKAPKV